VARLTAGLQEPEYKTLGDDIAGPVEAVGRNVKQFQPGDEVFGWGKGTFAEHARAGEDSLVPKPANSSTERTR
jgi:NADPH:quinone reductase-like Zn-dependent oxidoreductase